jgi:hypothetical protein
MTITPSAGRAKSRAGLERKLAAYAVAGGAVLAAAEEGQAGIVYSGPQNIPIGVDTTVDLDLNGTAVDYQFENKSADSGPPDFIVFERELDLNLQGTNQAASDINGNPLALDAGVDVASQSFNASDPGFMAGAKKGPVTGGNWVGASNKFLGLRFDIGGQTHYGWAQLTVSGSSDLDTAGTGTLIDWAYEDTLGASLLTGQTSGGVAAVPEPSTLILLATGAAALGAYRSLRRKQEGDVASDSQSR